MRPLLLSLLIASWSFAATPDVECFAPSGLTLDMHLFLINDDDTADDVVELAESSNAKGRYVGSTDTQTLVGVYHAIIVLRSGGNGIAAGYIVMADDEAIHRVSAGYSVATLDEDETTIDVDGTTVGTVTTVTNLTNAPTAGDLTATMKTSVNTEVNTAIETYGLDHLVSVAVDLTTEVLDNSIIAKLLSKAATAAADTFNNQTDSLQAISDKQ